MKEKIFKKGFLNRLLASLTAISIIFMGLPGTTAMAEESQWKSVKKITGESHKMTIYYDGAGTFDQLQYHALTCPVRTDMGCIDLRQNEWVYNDGHKYPYTEHETRELSCTCSRGGKVQIFVCDLGSTAREDHGSGNEDLDTCKHCGITFTASCDCSSLSSQNGQAPTCTEAGWKVYFQCVNEDCGKIYATDYNGGTSYADLNAWKASDVGKIDAPGHEWRYNASGATLTATCNRNSSHTATLTLTASSANYTGSAVTASYGDGEAATWKTAVGSDAPTITYEKKGAGSTWSAIASAPSAAGGYRAVAKVTKDGTDYIAYKEFTIGTAAITSVTFTEPTAPAYGGTPASSVAGTGANYSGAISWSPSAATFGYSTVYTATITLTAADNYKFKSDVTIPTNWTISASSTATSLVLTRTYTATEAGPHTCGSGVKQDGQAATCTADGFKDYYKCGSCDKLYKDVACTNEIEDFATWKTTDGQGKIAKLGHSWGYNASGATLTATCGNDASHTATLTLTANSANYSGIENLKAFNTATGKTVSTSNVKFYTVATEGATTGGTGETSTAPTADGYYYASLTVAGKTVVKAFTIGNPGGGSKPDPKPSPSKSKAAAAPTIPTDYVAERVAEEEAMEVTVVTVDTTQYSKKEETVVPGTSYNLSKFITTKGIVKGIKTAVAAANKDKKDTIEIYTGKPFCFNKEIIKTIQEGKKTVVYYFHYKGHIYSVTVPATVDASKVLEKAGFAGPLYVGKVLGTTKLVK